MVLFMLLCSVAESFKAKYDEHKVENSDGSHVFVWLVGVFHNDSNSLVYLCVCFVRGSRIEGS